MNSSQKSVDYLQQDFRNNRVDIKHSVQTKLHELITSSAKQRQVRQVKNSNLIFLGGLISFQKLMLVTVWGFFLAHLQAIPKALTMYLKRKAL